MDNRTRCMSDWVIIVSTCTALEDKTECVSESFIIMMRKVWYLSANSYTSLLMTAPSKYTHQALFCPMRSCSCCCQRKAKGESCGYLK